MTRNSTTLWPDETTRFVVCNEIWAVRSGCEILGGWPRVVHSSSNPEGTPFLVPKLAMEIMGMMGSAVGSMVMLWWAIVGGFACGSDECKGLILRIWSFLTIIAPSQSWGCHGVSSCHIFWGFFRGVTLRVWCFHRRGQNSKGNILRPYRLHHISRTTRSLVLVPSLWCDFHAMHPPTSHESYMVDGLR